MSFSPAGQYALSAGQGERQVALWRLGVPASKKTRASSGLLSLEEPAVQLSAASTSAGAPDDVSFQVCRAFSLASQDGLICHWHSSFVAQRCTTHSPLLTAHCSHDERHGSTYASE
jgi:hypothetical protein